MARKIKNWHGFIGQTSNIKLIKKVIKGSAYLAEPFPHSLISGPPGHGKSHLAGAIASEIDTEFFNVVATSHTKVCKIYKILYELNHKSILHIDEAHSLPVNIQEMLNQAIEDRKIPKMTDDGKLDSSDRVSIASFTLILSTDQPGQLLKSLLNRMSINLFITDYSFQEMRAIVENVLKKEGCMITTQGITKLTEAAAGVPRVARKSVELLLRIFPEGLERNLTLSNIDDFLNYIGTDKYGFSMIERKYLKLLGNKNGGPLTLTFISMSVGLDPVYICRYIESALITKNTLDINSKGRTLTSKGMKIYSEIVEYDEDNNEYTDDIENSQLKVVSCQN